MIGNAIKDFLNKVDETQPPVLKLDGMWTYSLVSETNGWVNPLLSSKKDAIRIGKKEAKKLGLTQFVIAQTTTELIDGFEFDCMPLITGYRENTVNVIGEVASDYLNDVTDKEYEDLQKQVKLSFEKWLERHKKKPPYYNLKNVESVVV